MPRLSKAVPRAIPADARFQSFSDRSEPEHSAARLAGLRAELARAGATGLLLPRADIFQGEYLPASEQRLAWLTAFTGSAGFAILLGATTALFVDGRYTEQARAEVDGAVITIVPLAEKSPEDWLAREAKATDRVAYDPSLVTANGLKRFEKAAAQAGFTLVPFEADPFAALWRGRPAPPASPVIDHPIEFAGEAGAAKLARLRSQLVEKRLDALLVSDCTNVNWLFNLRAADIPYLPILRAFALIRREGDAELFVDPARLAPDLARRLAAEATLVRPKTAPGDGAAEAETALIALAKAGARIRLDEASAPVRFHRAIEAAGGKADGGPDPLTLMKAEKNATEIAGARAAQLRDGAAMVRFLAWLDRTLPATKLTEIDAAVALEGFRAAGNELVDLSFPTISAAGPNAALPHYRVSEASNRRIEPGLYLVDSGAQYRDGTTDITRTIAVGRPKKAMREAFTRVLRGMIAVSLAVFPKGASGAQLDSFARAALWEAGQDFEHGTGHGVGSFLSVHEGPQGLSKIRTQALIPGMIVSNEPGYYRPGEFGIRIENLVVVEPRAISGAEKPFFGFETLTFCPIDRRLIVKSMLTRHEREWLDAYHAEVLAKIGPLVEGADRAFLEAACRPL